MSWVNKKVLVTGHEGFLGSWLTKFLLSKGAKIIGIDKIQCRPISVLKDLRSKIISVKGDIKKFSLLSALINEYKPNVIFHLAAEAIVSEANKNPLKTFRSNIEGTWNLLESIRNKKFIESVVIASSDKAYGIHNLLPYTEDSTLKGCHPYDVSKSCTDLIAHTYFHTYGVPVCVTRCGNIFGPGDFNFSRIIPDAIKCALSGKGLLIRSDGKFTRDYIYVEDVVSGYVSVAQKMKRYELSGEAFNFSNEKPISVLKLVELIYKLCQKDPFYEILNEARYEIRHQYLCSKKARKVLGWKAKHSLSEALRKTINWYKKHLDCK